MQVQGAQRVPKKMDPKRSTPTHIIIKMGKVKEKDNLKSIKRKTVTYKGAPIILTAYFLTETFQARRQWREIFKMMRSKNLQPRLLYSATL